MNIICIYNISGKIFQEIKYNNIDELNNILKLLIIQYDTDIYIHLILNDSILNNFNIINTLILSTITKYDFITIVFSQKKELYCLANEDGKYILDCSKTDNYSKLLELIILHYNNKSYDIIKYNTYKNLVLIGIKQNNQAFHASINLQNDKDFILEVVKQNGECLEFASLNLKNNKEIVLAAVKENKITIQYASISLQHDKDILLEINK